MFLAHYFSLAIGSHMGSPPCGRICGPYTLNNECTNEILHVLITKQTEYQYFHDEELTG